MSTIQNKLLGVLILTMVFGAGAATDAAIKTFRNCTLLDYKGDFL